MLQQIENSIYAIAYIQQFMIHNFNNDKDNKRDDNFIMFIKQCVGPM